MFRPRCRVQALAGLWQQPGVEPVGMVLLVAWLAARQKPDGEWDEAPYTAVGFPRVFYLRYHGYSKFFPLWAMARYRNLKSGNTRQVAWGM